ncbi:MAG: hypothetical protein V1494_03760 [Candidatus Diapherotrites archaeon]
MKKAILFVFFSLLAGLVCASAPLPLKLDFDCSLPFCSTLSPTMPGYTSFTASTHNSTRGYGWSSTFAMEYRDRGTGGDLLRDLQFTTVDKDFLVDVPNGEYNVTVHFYDAAFRQNSVNLDIEGARVVDGLYLPAGTESTQTFLVTVSDGQLTIGFPECGTKSCFLNGLEVEESGGCSEGATRACDTGLEGICSEGEQTCSGEVWGECGQTVFSETEICDNSLDDDCDGLIDCSDSMDCPESLPGCETPCEESWSCTFWSSCVNGTQTRTCTDANECGTTTNKPAESQSCSTPGEGVIFEDDFEGWKDVELEYPDLLWDQDSANSIGYASNGGWNEARPWDNYGHPPEEVITNSGRLNSNSLATYIEGGQEPSAGIGKCGFNNPEIHIRYYIKYDPTWEWWPNQNIHKLGRIKNLNGTCGGLPSGGSVYIIPAWRWGRMVYGWTNSPFEQPYSDPEVSWYDYGAGKWILIEDYVKVNDVIEGSAVSNGIARTWINGKKVMDRDDLVFRTDNGVIDAINIGDNIIYDGVSGSLDVPWSPPEEKTIWFDDIVFSTNYIGPEPCPDGTEITPENVGACYCGGTPSPTDSSNVHTNGYCCNGAWQTTSCTPATQCTVNIAMPCTISLAGGTINSCSQQNLIYQYNAMTTVNNTVNGLQASKGYDIKIENTTTGTTQNKTASTNSAGVLQFSS